MASISEQRLKEMEAEMNRFEQEIAPPDGKGPGGMIIGANTFNTVEAQLRQIRNESCSLAPPPPPPPMSDVSYREESGSGLDLPLSALAPPPPPPPEPAPDQTDPPPLLPPPPPPPPLLNPPAFVPPQLRHRPPPPRPPMHHMGPGPHGFPGHMGPGPGPMGPGPGPYNPPHMMGPPRPHMGQMGPSMMPPGPMGFPPQEPYPQQQQPGFPAMGGEGEGTAEPQETSNPAVIEAKPKVIYSAPPVRTVPKKTKKSKQEGKKPAEEEAETAGASGGDAAATVAMMTGIDGESYGGGGMQDDSAMVDMEIDMEEMQPMKKEKKEKKKKFIRTAASTVWEDPTLAEWDADDFRMFCGDLGNEVTDDTLQRAFGKYPSFIKAKVVRDRRTNKTKGYGFVSFRDPTDFARAIREMNGKYVGNRPIKLRKSTWKDRNIEVVRKKEKEKKRLGLR